jgi:hypothetical protein
MGMGVLTSVVRVCWHIESRGRLETVPFLSASVYVIVVIIRLAFGSAICSWERSLTTWPIEMRNIVKRGEVEWAVQNSPFSKSLGYGVTIVRERLILALSHLDGDLEFTTTTFSAS